MTCDAWTSRPRQADQDRGVARGLGSRPASPYEAADSLPDFFFFLPFFFLPPPSP